MVDVAAAIIRRDNTVLIARRALRERHAGMWEFPGGKVEPLETYEACLRRELKEELCIDVFVGGEIGECIYTYSQGTVHLVVFETEIIEGTPALTVHDAIAWVLPSALVEYALMPADILLIEKIKSHYSML